MGHASAHADCKRFVAVGNTEVTNTVYDVTCHKHCTLKGLPTETVNDPRLATCTAFKFGTDTAKSKFFGRKVTEFPGYGQSACKMLTAEMQKRVMLIGNVTGKRYSAPSLPKKDKSTKISKEQGLDQYLK